MNLYKNNQTCEKVRCFNNFIAKNNRESKRVDRGYLKSNKAPTRPMLPNKFKYS